MNYILYYIFTMLNRKLNTSDLNGVITALITPFDQHSNLNLTKYHELINHCWSGGISGIVALGTTGESPVLGSDEWRAVAEQAVKSSPDGKPVIIGVGTNCTRTTIQKSRIASEIGADGVLVVTPYYNNPTAAGLDAHFRAVADESELPVILYHIPGRSGVGIPLDLTLKLAEHSNIIGIKEAGSDLWRSSEIARQAPDDFVMLSGDDNLTLPLLSVGAVGVISVISNLFPEPFVKLVDAVLCDKLEQARQWHQKLSPLLSALSLETNPSPIKEALNFAGLDVGQVRAPLAPVTKLTSNTIRKAFDNLIGQL